MRAWFRLARKSAPVWMLHSAQTWTKLSLPKSTLLEGSMVSRSMVTLTYFSMFFHIASKLEKLYSLSITIVSVQGTALPLK